MVDVILMLGFEERMEKKKIRSWGKEKREEKEKDGESIRLVPSLWWDAGHRETFRETATRDNYKTT